MCLKYQKEFIILSAAVVSCVVTWDYLYNWGDKKIDTTENEIERKIEMLNNSLFNIKSQIEDLKYILIKKSN